MNAASDCYHNSLGSSLLKSNAYKSTNAAFSFPKLWKRRLIRPPVSIKDEIGVSPTFGYKYFDPLELANEDNFAFYRECELKHGRVAMMASIGMIVPDIEPIRSEIVPQILQSFHNNDDIVTLSHSISGIQSIQYIPKPIWIIAVIFIAFLEAKVFVQQDEKDMPGDYGTGYLGLRDKGTNERSLRSELENGRLAMIAFIYQVVSELLNGQSAGEQVASYLSSH